MRESQIMSETSRATAAFTPPRWLRLAWWPVAVPAWIVLALSLPFYLMGSKAGSVGGVLPPVEPLAQIFVTATLFLSFSTAVFSLLLSALLYRRGSGDRMALFLSLYLLPYGVSMAGPLEMLEPLLPGIARFNTHILISGLVVPLTLWLFLVFPDGHIAPRWSRWLVPAAVLSGPLYVLLTFQTGGLQASLRPIEVAFLSTFGVGIWVSLPLVQIQRYRHLYTQAQRQQTKWVLYGIGVWLVMQTASSPFWIMAQSLPSGTPYPLPLAISTTFWILSVAIIPMTLSIAVLRYRLYDIDLLISHTLLYGTLTAVVVALYVLVVGGLSAYLQVQGSLAISLLGTGLIAVLLQPLRVRLQRVVNRLIYGDRDDPAALLSRLSQRLEAAGVPDAVPTAIVETVVQALKLPYAAIEMVEDGSSVRLAEAGEPGPHLVRLAIVYQSEEVGQLVAAPRPPEATFSVADERVVRQVASQAGAALHALQLTQALRHSRARIVLTREEERRRLRRDLHDGLGPTLASQSLKLAAARRFLTDQPAHASDLLDDVLARNEGIIAEVRQIVYDLRPPSLDELGLVPALREHLHGLRDHDASALAVTVNTPDGGLPPLGAAIEVAAYRITLEALTNVYRHAQARRCQIDFELREGDLYLAIRDDGIGLPTACQPGVGLTSMRERAEEIGGSLSISNQPAGGTAIVALLPVEARA